jgi:hypothetical protein
VEAGVSDILIKSFSPEQPATKKIKIMEIIIIDTKAGLIKNNLLPSILFIFINLIILLFLFFIYLIYL